MLIFFLESGLTFLAFEAHGIIEVKTWRTSSYDVFGKATMVLWLEEAINHVTNTTHQLFPPGDNPLC